MPESRVPDLTIVGDDAELARGVGGPGAEPPLVHYTPTAAADLAKTLGLRPGGPAGGVALLVDAMVLEIDGRSEPVVNAVEVGTAPDRMHRWSRRHDLTLTIDGRPRFAGDALGAIVANGQFLRRADIVPRGHPGDGRVEVQVYALRSGEVRAMRDRLATGSHLPHPRIFEGAGRVIEIETARPVPIRADGVMREPARRMRIGVLPGALKILA